MCNALLRYLKVMEVNIRRSGTLEVYWIKVIGFGLLKMGNEGRTTQNEQQPYSRNLE